MFLEYSKYQEENAQKKLWSFAEAPLTLWLNSDLPIFMKKLCTAGKRKETEGQTIPGANATVRIVSSLRPVWKDFVIIRSLSKILRKFIALVLGIN